MERAVRIEYRSRPSPVRFMARALWPSAGFGDGSRLPAIAAHWREHRPDPAEITAFERLSGLRHDEAAHLPFLYPHTIAFPLHMVVLTHPQFPVPIWRVLQVRNRLVQHRPLGKGESFDIQTRTSAHRILDKGVEVDLHTTMVAGADVVWECTNTFYARGRFGKPAAPAATPRSPEIGGEIVDRWVTPREGGRRFGRLTGDYNGLHLFDWYARRMGFAGAFLHPQRVLGQCVERLLAGAWPESAQLEAWLKGPVFYGAPVELRASNGDGATTFALTMEGQSRPAIVGRLYGARKKCGDR